MVKTFFLFFFHLFIFTFVVILEYKITVAAKILSRECSCFHWKKTAFPKQNHGRKGDIVFLKFCFIDTIIMVSTIGIDHYYEFNGQCRGTHAVTILSMSVVSVLLFEFFILFFVFKARCLNHFFLFLKILVFIFYD